MEDKRMEKVRMGAVLPIMPLPICLVGADVDGKPNFNTIAWMTMLGDSPPIIGLVMGKKRRTKDGIRVSKTFSVNVPSADMMELVDYCGMRSGYKEDKSDVFKVFYGALDTAPMVEECPINIECKFLQEIAFEKTDLLVGEIVDVLIDEDCTVDGAPDLERLNLPVFLMPDGPYYRMGEFLAEAYRVKKRPKSR